MATTVDPSAADTEIETKASMGPPPPRGKYPNPATDPEIPRQTASTSDDLTNLSSEESSASASTTTAKSRTSAASAAVPYTVPEWSGPPRHKFYLEVLKDGSIIDSFDVREKGAYTFGRVDLCDFILEHPTISRFHAVLQFKQSGDAYLYDLGSTHGTFINKSQVEKRVYVDLHVGDVIRFGCSSRLYIFQGPPDLMAPEVDRKTLKDAKIRQEMLDREASLERARREASLADGISWGMGEDAIEEDEDDADEVTWQTYKGQLTEKQEKTREKITKRYEKIAHMRKEIDAIRAKDIAQGGLTQGQQTQIARNEQRITQIMEELENLEETLNESIQESLGARTGKSRARRTGITEEEYEPPSDDDEFYDRTKKPAKQKAGENQSVETADSLLDKRDAIMKEIEDKKELLSRERSRLVLETAAFTEAGDALDAFMSGLSSQLVFDKSVELEKELSSLQSVLDRIFILLKIADPSGEATKKRDSRTQEEQPAKAELHAAPTRRQPPKESKITNSLRKPADVPVQHERVTDSVAVTSESNNKPESEKVVLDAAEGKTEAAVYTAVKPQWLGAVHNRNNEETQQLEALNIEGSDQFVDYKDWQKIMRTREGNKLDSDIESAASGLIVRKRKEVVKPGSKHNEVPEQSTSTPAGTELLAEDAVALLLKHKRGHHAEDEEMYSNQELSGGNEPGKDKKKPKRVLGPEKPSFINTNSDYETWVPPEGQSGDGRTFLNDRFGY